MVVLFVSLCRKIYINEDINDVFNFLSIFTLYDVLLPHAFIDWFLSLSFLLEVSLRYLMILGPLCKSGGLRQIWVCGWGLLSLDFTICDVVGSSD